MCENVQKPTRPAVMATKHHLVVLERPQIGEIYNRHSIGADTSPTQRTEECSSIGSDISPERQTPNHKKSPVVSGQMDGVIIVCTGGLHLKCYQTLLLSFL